MPKLCPGCRILKSSTEFHRRVKTGRLRSRCKSCELIERNASYHKRPIEVRRHARAIYNAWRGKNPAYGRDYNRLKKFGVSRERYDQMLAAQGGRCGICRSDNPRSRRVATFAIDHCHATGVVRGLLCIPCNVAIGMFKDSPERAISASQYLSRTVEAGTSEGLLF